MNPGQGKDPFAEAEEFLSQKRSPQIEELFLLIHKINPTGMDLPDKARKEAYRTKAALQSLLILEFSEELVLSKDEKDGEGVLGIRHRVLPFDACHAVVSHLEPEARFQALLKLDWAEKEERDGAKGPSLSSAIPETKQLRSSSIPEIPRLLSEGDAALETYDYPKAEEFYGAALTHPEMSSEEDLFGLAVLKFLGLLVDCWVDDDRALRFVESLPKHVKEKEEVRGLWATSLARKGLIPKACRLVQALEGEQAYGACLEIARGYLGEDELASCLAYLDRIPQGSSFYSAKQSLRLEVQRAEKERAKGLLDVLREAQSQGRFEDAESLAREILSLDPKNEEALDLLHLLVERRQGEKAASLQKDLEESLKKGLLEGAQVLLERLRVEAGETGKSLASKWTERVISAKEAQKKKERDQELCALKEALGFPFEGRMIEAFWKSDEEVRRSFLKGLEDSTDLKKVCGWCLEMGPVKGVPAREEAAKALQALLQAEKGEDQVRSWDSLGPYFSLLQSFPSGKRLLKKVQAEGRKQQKARIQVTLERLESLLADQPEKVLEQWDTLDLRWLEGSERKALERIREKAEEMLEIHGLKTSLQEAREQQDHFRALHFSNLLLAKGRGNLEKLRKQREELCTSLEGHFEDQAEGKGCAYGFFPNPLGGYPLVVSWKDRPLCFQIEQRGSRLFLWAFEEGFSQCSAAVFSLPPTMCLLGWTGKAESLSLVLNQGMLQFSFDGRFHFQDFHLWPKGRCLDSYQAALFFQGLEGLVLLRSTPGGRGFEFRLFDTELGLFRTSESSGLGIGIGGEGHPTSLILSRHLNDVEGLDAHGHTRWIIRGSQVYYSSISHPNQATTLAAVGIPRETDLGGMEVVLLEIQEGGRWKELCPLGAFRLGTGEVKLATDSSQGLLFSRLVSNDGETLLTACSLQSGVEHLWEVALPQDSFLILDPNGENAFLWYLGEKGPALVRLGAEKPKVDPSPFSRVEMGELNSVCRWMGEGVHGRQQLYEGLFPYFDNASLLARVRSMVQNRAPLEELLAIGSHPLPQGVEEVLEQYLLRAHGEDPAVTMLMAEKAFFHGKDNLAEEFLAKAEALPMSPHQEQHRLHLQALHLFGKGEMEKASQRAEVANQLEGFCSKGLSNLSELLGFWILPLKKTKKKGATSLPAFRIARLREALQAVSKGKWERVLPLLEDPLFWKEEEFLFLSLLGSAYAFLQELKEGTPWGRIRAKRLLTSFREEEALGEGLLSLTGRPPKEILEKAREAARVLLGEEASLFSSQGAQGEPDPFFDAGGSSASVLVYNGDSFFPRTGILEGDGLSHVRLPWIQRRMRSLPLNLDTGQRVGILVSKGHPQFHLFQGIAQHFFGDPPSQKEAFLPLVRNRVFEMFAGWPEGYAAVSQFHGARTLERCSTLIHLTQESMGLMSLPS